MGLLIAFAAVFSGTQAQEQSPANVRSSELQSSTRSDPALHTGGEIPVDANVLKGEGDGPFEVYDSAGNLEKSVPQKSLMLNVVPSAAAEKEHTFREERRRSLRATREEEAKTKRIDGKQSAKEAANEASDEIRHLKEENEKLKKELAEALLEVQRYRLQLGF